MAIAEKHETALGDVNVQKDRVFAPRWAAEISPRHTFQVWNATEDYFGALDYSFDCFAAPEEHTPPQDTDTLWWCVFSAVFVPSLSFDQSAPASQLTLPAVSVQTQTRKTSGRSVTACASTNGFAWGIATI